MRFWMKSLSGRSAPWSRFTRYFGEQSIHRIDYSSASIFDGIKDIFGLWIELNEGAKFWLRVMNEIKNRGVEDILIAVVDGLKGFPNTTVQTCVVHLLRQSLSFVFWKDRKAVAAALKDIYRAVLAASLGRGHSGEVRRLLYTTNAIESMNAKLRRAVRARGHFPNKNAAMKLLFPVLNRTEKEWTSPARAWCMAKAKFAILFGTRFTKVMA